MLYQTEVMVKNVQEYEKEIAKDNEMEIVTVNVEADFHYHQESQDTSDESSSSDQEDSNHHQEDSSHYQEDSSHDQEFTESESLTEMQENAKQKAIWACKQSPIPELRSKLPKLTHHLIRPSVKGVLITQQKSKVLTLEIRQESPEMTFHLIKASVGGL